MRKKTLLHPHNNINVRYACVLYSAPVCVCVCVCVLAPPGVSYRRQHSSNDFVNKLKLVNRDWVPRSWHWPNRLTHTRKHTWVNIHPCHCWTTSHYNNIKRRPAPEMGKMPLQQEGVCLHIPDHSHSLKMEMHSLVSRNMLGPLQSSPEHGDHSAPC